MTEPRQPRQLAVVHSYRDLITALRARADELDVARATLDSVSGLQNGYCSKLLSGVPVRGLGQISFGAIIGALGTALILVEDLSAFEKIQKQLVRRTNKRRQADAAMPTRKRKKKSALLGNSEWGKIMRARSIACASPEKRSRWARRAANALWRQRRLLARQKPVDQMILPPGVPATGVELVQHSLI